MNINIINLYNDPNYIYSQNFGIYIINEIIKTYFDNSIKYLEKSDFNVAFKYSSFFDKYSINHPYMSFIYIYPLPPCASCPALITKSYKLYNLYNLVNKGFHTLQSSIPVNNFVYEMWITLKSL